MKIKIREARGCIEKFRKELEEHVRETCMIIILLEAGGEGIKPNEERTISLPVNPAVLIHGLIGSLKFLDYL